ncbi:MAG: homoserine dehydrogenase [Faecousia sp.]
MKYNKPMRIALLGLGTVGYGVYEFLKNRTDMEVACALSLVVPDGVTCPIAKSIDEILSDESIDTVVEVIGGLHPAYEWVKGALSAGKNVITANKLLIARHYSELVSLSRERGVALRCTAAAGGGIPWLTSLKRCADQEPVIRISGIMNGTTNFILDTMHRTGGSFADALKEAQRLGYAEANPADDLNGADIRRKLVISSNIAYGGVVNEDDVAVEGIEHIQDVDIAAFKRMGRVCKLIAASRKLDGCIAAYIEPALVPPSMPESAIPDNYNLISLTGQHIGKQSFYGQGAGRYPTAYNVLQDCVDVLGGVDCFYTDRLEPLRVDNSSIERPYYVRTNGVDKWLQARIDKMLDCGIMTKAVSVTEIHAWAKERRKTDPSCFIASLR